MFSLHYVGDNDNDNTRFFKNDIEVYSIYHNKDKKFLSFATIRVNRTEQMICFSNFDNLSLDMRKELYQLIRESKDELGINGYKVSPFYAGYTSYVATYDTAYI